MQQKAFTLINKGMNRDLSVSKTGESCAFDNHNIRIEARDGDTMLSVTNERGNKEIVFSNGDTTIAGTVIGWNVLNNHIILFTHDEDGSIDRIYRVDYEGDEFNNNKLFEGNLNFDAEHPIESIVSFETDAVQKIYWVDGKNVLRFMNFIDDSMPWGTDNTYFDTNRSAQFSASATISKNNSGNSRPNGVVQYLLTYFNKHGQETNYTWMSDLVYLSPLGRGGAADETNNNKVTLTFSNLDTSFSHFRVYSVFRSSLDGQTVAYLVYEGRTSDKDVIVTDDGAHLTLQDSTRLLYLGSQAVIAGTITHKDETLFLGDLQSVGKSSYPILEQVIRQNMIDWSVGLDKGWESKAIEFAYSTGEGDTPHIPYIVNGGLYPYKNQLEYTSSEITTFKGGEKYRFGLKFQLADGTETGAFWIGDKINNLYPVVDSAGGFIRRVIAKCTIPAAVMAQVQAVPEIKTVQLVMAEATYADRSIKAQGVINPTMFNTLERYQNRLYSIPSWVARPRHSRVPALHFQSVNNASGTSAEIQCSYWEGGSQSPNPYFVYDNYTSDTPGYANGKLDGSGAYDMTMLLYKYKHGFENLEMWVRTDVCVIRGNALNNTGLSDLIDCTIPHEPLNWRGGDDFWTLTKDAWVHNETNYVLTCTMHYGATTYDLLFGDSTKAIKFVYSSVKDSVLKYEEIEDYNFISESVYNTLMHSSSMTAYRYTLGREPYAGYSETASTVLNATPKADRWLNETLQPQNKVGNHKVSNSKRHVMYVDENVLTLHSPEVATGAVSFDNAQYKFRIVGVAKITSDIADYTIKAEPGKYTGDNVFRVGFSRSFGDSILSNGLLTWPLWLDFDLKPRGANVTYSEPKTDSEFFERDENLVGYWMYMWQKAGNITSYFDKKQESSGDDDEDLTYDDHEYSILNNKRYANLHFSYQTIYSIDPTQDYTPASLRDYNYLSSQFVQISINDSQEYYDANIDTVLSVPRFHKYPVFYSEPDGDPNAEIELLPDYNKNIYSTASVPIQFRSPAHSVVTLRTYKDSGYYCQTLLPYIFESEKQAMINRSSTLGEYSGALLPWIDYVNHDASSSEYPYIDFKPIQSQYAFNTYKNAMADGLADGEQYLLVGEIYEDFSDNDNRYGGITDAAIQNNRFIAAGPSYNIAQLEPDSVGGYLIYGNQSDTYIQRWDSVKTMPYSDDAQNQVTDITSFLVETHVNIDGRTDRQRGINNLTAIDFSTYNNINLVYSQKDNFKVSRDLDEDFDTDSYRSSITWTLPKADLADVDEWTHVTLASTLKLDGDKGICHALRRFGNTILAFQNRGISEVLFNSRTQISTVDGVPVEIGNSGKVDGKRYISNKFGCLNKWSITEGKSGLYFVDNINKSFCAATVDERGRISIQPLSARMGFSTWFRTNNRTESWNPKDFGNIISFYDKVHSDVYLMTKDAGDESCLVYNEALGTFSSFFNYNSVPMMVNVEDKFVAYRNGVSHLWLQNEGLYCNFFGEQFPFWTTYRVAPDPIIDKIWTNLELQSDFYRVLDENGESMFGPEVDITSLDEEDYQEEETIDEIEIWNEYQSTGRFLERPAKRFRTWRYDIPRAASNDSNLFGLDRIRNPWIYLKLKKNPLKKENQDLMQLHDIVIKYFE